MASALQLACEKLQQKERERERRRECEKLIAAGVEFKKKIKKKSRIADKRLDRWQLYLRDRRILCGRIMKRTGKTPGQILLNCSGVVEKAMIQRLLDQADRLSPENQWRTELVKQSPTRCGLECTLPDNNVVRNLFTVYGLPEVSRQESNSACCIQNWFRSKAISERFEKKKLDIFNIIDHYPDVENLQVIGIPMTLHLQDETEEAAEEEDQREKEARAQALARIQALTQPQLKPTEKQRRSVNGRKTRQSKSRVSKSK